jgi:hypothetical protein
MANKKTPLEQWEQALRDVDDFGKQSPIQAQMRLIAAGERLAAAYKLVLHALAKNTGEDITRV